MRNNESGKMGIGMKILMVTPGRLPLPSVRGGAVESLVQMLLDYNEKHKCCEMHILSLADSEAEKENKKYKYSTFFYIRMRSWYKAAMAKHILPYRLLDYFFARKASTLIRKKREKYDYVIIQNETVNGSVFYKHIKGNYIFHAHNDIVTSVKPQETGFLRNCKKIISISNYLSANLKKDYNLEQVTTVYNGIDTKLFSKNRYLERRDELRKCYGINKDDVVVVFSGRMVAEKGVKELLQAFMMLPGNTSMKLLMIGSNFFGKNQENPYLKELKELCENRKEDIIFTGYVKYENMPAFYAMGDIGCIPSVWDEPFGLTVIEQMAMELPVVVTDAGAIPELVDESCGCIVKRDAQICYNLASAIEQLCKNKELRAQMGQQGRRIVEETFSMESYCAKWFQTVCESNNEMESRIQVF